MQRSFSLVRRIKEEAYLRHGGTHRAFQNLKPHSLGCAFLPTNKAAASDGGSMAVLLPRSIAVNFNGKLSHPLAKGQVLFESYDIESYGR